jgi:hypothetical protein
MALIELDVELLARLGEAVTQLTQEVTATRKERAASTKRPNTYKMIGSAVADSSGYALIVLDCCPQGQRWTLRKVVVGGVTWATSAAGACQIVVTSQPNLSADSPIALFNVEDGSNSGLSAGTAMPLARSYPSDQVITLDAGDWLCVYITGGTNAQQYCTWARVDRHFLDKEIR